MLIAFVSTDCRQLSRIKAFGRIKGLSKGNTSIFAVIVFCIEFVFDVYSEEVIMSIEIVDSTCAPVMTWPQFIPRSCKHSEQDRRFKSSFSCVRWCLNFARKRSCEGLYGISVKNKRRGGESGLLSQVASLARRAFEVAMERRFIPIDCGEYPKLKISRFLVGLVEAFVAIDYTTMTYDIQAADRLGSQAMRVRAEIDRRESRRFLARRPL